MLPICTTRVSTRQQRNSLPYSPLRSWLYSPAFGDDNLNYCARQIGSALKPHVDTFSLISRKMTRFLANHLRVQRSGGLSKSTYRRSSTELRNVPPSSFWQAKHRL